MKNLTIGWRGDIMLSDNEKNINRRIDMIQLGEFFKRRKWIIAVAGLLVIALTAALFLTTGATRGISIPPLHMILDDGTVIDAVRGGYNWNFGTVIPEYRLADTEPVYKLEYSDANTVTVSRGQTLYISNARKRGRFNGTGITAKIYHLGGTLSNVSLSLPETEKDYFFLSPEETGEYYFEMEIEYSRGSVFYGFQVTVSDRLPAETLGWAQKLSADEVDRIEIVRFNPENRQFYKDLSPDEIKQAITFINESGGRYVANPTVYSRDNEMLYITTKDGKIHSFVNHHDTYLVIDKRFWEVNSEWLVSGFAQFQTETPVPDSFWDRINTGLVANIPKYPPGIEPPAPGVQVKLEEYYGGANDALEVIYEDTHYKYSLSSIRSDKIMLTFEDGQTISLKEAVSKNKIGIDDLILNGLQVYIQPKNNPMGGEFNYHPLGEWHLNDYQFFPSNHFMYIAAAPGSGNLNAYFAYDELMRYISLISGSEYDYFVPAEKLVTIEGIAYIGESDLRYIDTSAEIGWTTSRVRAPVVFRFTGSPSS